MFFGLNCVLQKGLPLYPELQNQPIVLLFQVSSSMHIVDFYTYKESIVEQRFLKLPVLQNSFKKHLVTDLFQWCKNSSF